jgi:hypothetical protein
MNYIVGKRVEFSISSGKVGRGVVLDRIEMLNGTGGPVVTGYLIEEETLNELKPIQNWRMLKTLPDDNPPTHVVEGGQRDTW